MSKVNHKKFFKTEFKEPTPVSKMKNHTKTDRINKLNQLRQNKLNSTILQKRGIIDKDGESTINSINATNLTALIDYTDYVKSPFLCVLVALNEEADLQTIAKDVYSLFEKDKVSLRMNENLFTGIIPLDIVKGKERITVVCSDRNTLSVLDYCKVADLVIFVSSCKAKSDLTLLKKDPYTAVNPMDELGYETISAIKAQGIISHIAIIQHLETIEDKYRQEMKKLYTRYYDSELTPMKTITLEKINEDNTNLDDYKALLRTIVNAKTYEEKLNLRKHKSYMLCDNFYPQESQTNKNEINLVVEGYVRGNTINHHNYAHLTGFGDFIILEVNDEIEDPCSVVHKVNKKEEVINKHKNVDYSDINIINSQNNQIKETDNPEVLGTSNTRPIIVDDAFRDKKLDKQDKMKIENDMNNEIDDIIDFDLEAKEEDISFHDEEEEKLIKEQETVHMGLSRKHEAKTNLYYRTPEDMEVPDEVDTPINMPCRELFSKYRGLSSMATGSLDPTVNLPKEYSNIYSFENLRYTFKESVKKAHETGIRCSGKYVRIVLKNFKDFHLLQKDKPLILSTLLSHERKLCVMHFRIQLRDDIEPESIYSKQLIEAQVGFRRILCRPIYSLEVGETDKLKKVRKLEKGRYYIATVYAQLTYPEVPVFLFRPNAEYTMMQYIAIGKTWNSDCNRILLKKIVLTGYPLKIHKKKAVVRYMFFNPEDVNYFKPVPIHTKFGLKGNITESLGIHGHMKCTFNDNIKPNDTVCLSLFKRVFPVWFPESWRLALGYSRDSKYFEVYKKDTEEFNKKELERYKVVDEENLDEKLKEDKDKKMAMDD